MKDLKLFAGSVEKELKFLNDKCLEANYTLNEYKKSRIRMSMEIILNNSVSLQEIPLDIFENYLRNMAKKRVVYRCNNYRFIITDKHIEEEILKIRNSYKTNTQRWYVDHTDKEIKEVPFTNIEHFLKNYKIDISYSNEYISFVLTNEKEIKFFHEVYRF